MGGQSQSLEGVIEASWPHWRAEFEIGYTAFNAANVYRDTGWLAAQIWKEWTGSGVYGPRGTDLSAEAAGANAADELAHYHSLKRLVPLMELEPAAYRPGPAALTLAEYRHGCWDDQQLSYGVQMSEGGGLGLFHGAIRAIDARGASQVQDAPVREALSVIIADEVRHLGQAVRAFVAAQIADADPIYAVLDRCLQFKVAERREQFAPQLSGGASAPEALVANYRRAITAALSGP